MDAATVQSSSAAQFGAAEMTQALREENGKEMGIDQCPLCSVTLRAHGINDLDYLSAFHP